LVPNNLILAFQAIKKEMTKLSKESRPHNNNDITNTTTVTMRLVCIVSCLVGHTTLRISLRAALSVAKAIAPCFVVKKIMYVASDPENKKTEKR
jgi:hypothetical protein